jgi:prepilin-type N-terminal cleavage/methylation domain-containing protein/prepilin-type processing-associated H-X9-DG protein
MNTVQILTPSWSPAKRGRKSGFTLIELLVVIAIIAILAAVAFPLASRMIAAGHTGKATANLRQIGALMASYTADNNNCLPILLDWGSPMWYPPWQGLLSKHAGLREDIKSLPRMFADCFYDPVFKEKDLHPYGSFGGNNAIMLGLGGEAGKDCRTVYGQDRGTPLSAIGSPSTKVLVASATDAGRYKGCWYFHGYEWASQGDSYSGAKPDARHGGKALCLFADGHTEALDVANMTAADRRKYFLRDEN